MKIKSGIPLMLFMYIWIALAVFWPAMSAGAGEKTAVLETPARGGELLFGLGATPLHLNPAIHSGTLTGIPGAQIFASPLRFDANWNPQPYLAEKWEVAKDGLSVTLHLVKHARFHDGTQVTAEDVAFSIGIVQEHHPFSTMFASVERVDTPGRHTAVIRLKRPHPAILLAMSSVLLPILPKHIYGDGRDIGTHPANMAPVGSGPFRFREFVPGKHIILVRNDDFFIRGRPFLDGIRFLIFLDPVVEVPISLEAGETHIFSFFTKPSAPLRVFRGPHLVTTTKGFQGIGSISWLAFNLRKKPFDDIRVRKALAYSIDRKFIVKTFFEGRAQPALGPISPDSPFYSTDVEHYDLDVKKANDLLDKAGYPRDSNGRRFSVPLEFVSDDAGIVLSVLEYLRMDLLRKTGVELVVENPMNFQHWAEKISSGDFQISQDEVYNWGDPVIGVHRTYDSRNIRKGVIWSNTQGYANPRVDALMDAAGTEMNPEKRKALYAEFQKIVVDELPVLWLYKTPYMTIHHRDLAGMGDSIWGVMSPLDRVFFRRSR